MRSVLQNMYKLAGLEVATFEVEAESSAYGACRFSLNGKSVVFRIAKTTPTKVGQFVTIWKRQETSGEITPLDAGDGIDFVIIHVSDGTQSGQFVFDIATLLAKGIMSSNDKGGKRGIRVYPPWSKPVAKDAIKTKTWQIRHFLHLSQDGCVDFSQVQKYF